MSASYTNRLGYATADRRSAALLDEPVPCLWCGEPLPDSRADAPYCCGECRTNNNDEPTNPTTKP